MFYPIRKKWNSLLIVVAAAAGIFADVTFMSQDTIDLQHSVRKIMLDGFLLEWNTQTARPWGSDTGWQWNAMATPEGPAGYLIASRNAVEAGWTITFNGSLLQQPLKVTLPQDSTHKSKHIRVDITQSDSNDFYVIEWLFPWSEQTTGAEKSAIVTFQAQSVSGKALPEIVVRCKKLVKRNSVWGGVTGRVIVIGLLALMYFFVQRRLKHQTARKESPRR